MEPLKLGILGLGTVGGGVVEYLRAFSQQFSERAGCEIVVTRAAVRDCSPERKKAYDGIALCTDVMAVAQDPDLDVLVELIGGVDLAYSAIKAAIASGKSVVTANKALIAEHGGELFAMAEQRGVCLCFEAAVAGGIPIVRTLQESLAGDRVTRLVGIINGTSNFILSRMHGQAEDFKTSLGVASDRGYAEADPTLDIGGFDARDKLVILAALAFGQAVDVSDCWVEGISDIEAIDVEYAKMLGFVIKPLAVAQTQNDALTLRVHPSLISKDHLLAEVHGAMNAIELESESLGPSLYYGAGAGRGPTASAVLADIVSVARAGDCMGRHSPVVNTPNPYRLADAKNATHPFYLRLHVAHMAGTLAKITEILANHDISISTLIQKESRCERDAKDVVILTEATSLGVMDSAITAINALSSVTKPAFRLRIEHFSDEEEGA